MGVLLYTPIFKPCQRKRTQPAIGQPNHLYEEVILAEDSREKEDSGDKARAGSSVEMIVTYENETYSEVKLARSRV